MAIGDEIIELSRELCTFRTAVVADENEALFKRIADEIPIEVFRFPSGAQCNGWLVPENWRVVKAKILREGKEVFDGKSHTLGVAYYSNSYQGELEWEELAPHLVTNPGLPEAYMFHCMWQYRPWDADWALSVPYRVYEQLGTGRYTVELVTEREPGEMLVGHSEVPGRSDKTIVFNSNTCHPHMANDGFAGTAVLIRLMQWLATRDNHYTYRLVLGPEHLGSVFYLAERQQSDVERMLCGVFEEMPGTGGAIKATSTFLGNQFIDTAFSNVLKHYCQAYSLVPWRKGAGNDETVWEAPGYEVPFVELTRCEEQFAPFREYHSSLDTPDLMVPGQIEEMLMTLQKVVEILEENVFVHRKFNGLICLSNPEYGLYMERPDPSVVKDLEEDSEKWGHLLDCLFRYMDGRHHVLDIAERHDLPFDRLLRYLKRFEEKDLLELEFAEIDRRPAVRV